MASQAITIGDTSISGTLQGVEIRRFDQVYDGLIAKIRPMNSSPIMTVDGVRVDDLRLFDENLSTAVSTKKVEQFPNFEREELSLGFSKDFKDEPPFEDMDRFDPVSFINDDGSTLIYPQVLWNLSANELDSYNGVIEPLTIRARASRTSIEDPYYSHDVRGALSNAAEDVRHRGNLIVDFVFPVDRSVEHYLDGVPDVDTLGVSGGIYLSDPTDFASPFADGTDWEDQQNYELGTALRRTRLEPITDWDPSHVVYYTVAGDARVVQDFRSLMVAHLNFETSASSGATVVDKTGNGNDGTLKGLASVDLLDRPDYITGRGSLNLIPFTAPGTSQDYLRIDDDPSLRATLGSGFSISLWIKFDFINPVEQIVLRKGPAVAFGEYEVRYQSLSGLTFRIWDTASIGDSTSNQLRIISGPFTTEFWKSWNYVTFTYDGGALSSSVKLYVNGISYASGVKLGTFTSPKSLTGALDIGDVGRLTSTANFRGRIASFEFWNVALSAKQSKMLYDFQTIYDTTSFQYTFNGSTYEGIEYSATLGEVSTEQSFPRNSVSSTSGQTVNLQHSPGTDSIAYVGMKR